MSGGMIVNAWVTETVGLEERHIWELRARRDEQSWSTCPPPTFLGKHLR